MTPFKSFSDLRAFCLDLPSGHPAASTAVAQREATLTKPPRSLGRLRGLPAELRGAIAAFPRQALHAVLIGFRHPASGEYVQFISPLPKDIADLIGFLDRI